MGYRKATRAFQLVLAAKKSLAPGECRRLAANRNKYRADVVAFSPSGTIDVCCQSIASEPWFVTRYQCLSYSLLSLANNWIGCKIRTSVSIVSKLKRHRNTISIFMMNNRPFVLKLFSCRSGNDEQCK